MYKSIISILMFFISTSAFASDKDLAYLPSEQAQAVDVMNQVYYVNQFYSFSHVPFAYQPKGLFTLIKSGHNIYSQVKFERYMNFAYTGAIKAKDLILFTSGALRGTSILMTDYNDPQRSSMLQVWVPQIRKVRRVPQPPANDLWLGSAFTHGDMKLRKPQHEQHEVIAIENYNHCAAGMENIPCMSQGKKVLVVKSWPLNHYPANYDYRLSYIDTYSYADYRTEYYRNGKLVKEVEKNWLPVDMPMPRALIFTHWFVKDYDLNTESLLMMQPLEKETFPEMWTDAFLRKTKR
ncbi:MAG: outer membrane lipoprotein-sorting protein [Bdellovibrionales bacterium]|nr:outer membrane lipoprotein-sorting protein [Bdellovibrionales bacterium]